MSTSDARSDANRRNSQKSTGPKTDSGKARSSKNALKHGMTSQDIVLPNENPQDYRDRLEHWNSYYLPADPTEAALIERAVSAKWKLDRITRVETQKLSLQVRHAEDVYNLEQFSAAEELGKRLIFEPIGRCEVPQVHDPAVYNRLEQRDLDIPAVLTRELQNSASGAQFLIERWVELGDVIRLHGYLHYPEKLRAIRMLGRNPEDVVEDPLVQEIFCACNVAHPGTHDKDPDCFSFLDECIQARLGIVDKPMFFMQVEQIQKLRPKTRQAAEDQLWNLVESEVGRLKTLKADYLDPLDASDRAGARARAMFDSSKEAVLMRRYETACEREFHKSIAGIQKIQKAKDFTPEPPDSDDTPAPPDDLFPNEPISEPVSDSEVTDFTPLTSHSDTTPDSLSTHQPVSKRPIPALIAAGTAPPGAV